MKKYKVENIIEKTPLCDVKLGGYVGELMEKFFRERIFSDHARNVVYKEAEDAFVNQADDNSEIYGLGIWQGEFWGKWIISAARVYRYSGSEELKEFIHKGALKLISLQREDGYLGTYKKSYNFISAPREVSSNDWNWNIWCRKYTLWGMLECYEITGDERVLDCCVGMANQLIDELKSTGTEIGDTGTFKGMPSCSIMKPMLILYRLTENEKYLSFCLDIAKRWENPGIMPGLIANSLSKKPLTEWYDGPSKRWAKAYEMMSCFDGLCELYRVTGDKKYLDACESFFDILMKHERNPLYSVAYNDVFADAAYDVNALTEPCDIIHLMRLCHELFCISGNSKYMDAFELAFYNPFIASAFKDGKWGARAARAAGRHLVALEQAKFKYNHCCVNNMPRGFMNMAESCVMSGENSIIINFYTPVEAKTAGAKVKITGDYLADSSAEITVDFAGAPLCDIKLRIPEWSKKSVVTVNGVSYTPDSGFFTVKPEELTVIKVSFDNGIRIRKIVPHPQKSAYEWKINSYTAPWNPEGSADPELYLTSSRCVIQKGVLLLCRTKLIGNTEDEMFGTDELIDESCECTAERVAPSADVNLQYKLTFKKNGESRCVNVCDYASGTNMMLIDDKRFFSIYF